MSLDLKVKQILMSAHLYYDRGVSVLSDAEFDDLCIEVVDNWDELTAYQQWQLGDPLDLVSTGCGVRLTRAAVGGAEAWYEKMTGKKIETPYEFWPDGESSDNLYSVGYTGVRG